MGFVVIWLSRHSPRPEAIELKEEVENHNGQRVRDDVNVDTNSMREVEGSRCIPNSNQDSNSMRTRWRRDVVVAILILNKLSTR